MSRTSVSKSEAFQLLLAVALACSPIGHCIRSDEDAGHRRLAGSRHGIDVVQSDRLNVPTKGGEDEEEIDPDPETLLAAPAYSG